MTTKIKVIAGNSGTVEGDLRGSSRWGANHGTKDSMNDPDTRLDADVIPLPSPASAEEYQIPAAIAADLRKYHGQIIELSQRLGQARSEYLGREADLMRELSKAQQSFNLGAKAALMAVGIDAKADEAWDLDIPAGTIRKAG